MTKSYLGEGRGLRLGDHRNDRWRDDAELRPDGYSDVDGCIAGIWLAAFTFLARLGPAEGLAPTPRSSASPSDCRMEATGWSPLRAVDRADHKKIADGLGVRRADLKLASGDEIAGDLGMGPGGVAPLPITGATVVIDRRAAALTTIFCGTGRNDAP